MIIYFRKNFVTLENYSQSKLAILMFTKKLARELKQLNIPVRVNAVHPGIVNTELFLHDNSYFRFLKFLTDILIKVISLSYIYHLNFKFSLIG